MTTAINHWPAYQKRWEFNGTAEEAVIFSGANGGYEARMQHQFLMEQGLKPNHRFLDLGCGALRGTVRLVDYLEEGRFFGVDISMGLLKEALNECHRQKFAHMPILSLIESFDEIPTLGGFHAILCNSLTVHIEPEDIQGLLQAIRKSLLPSGSAYISVHPLNENDPENYKSDGYRWWYKRSWIQKEASKVNLSLCDFPGTRPNRVPGVRKPIIPIVNTCMTEWMMVGKL